MAARRFFWVFFVLHYQEVISIREEQNKRLLAAGVWDDPLVSRRWEPMRLSERRSSWRTRRHLKKKKKKRIASETNSGEDNIERL